jgi:hypothetical protein
LLAQHSFEFDKKDEKEKKFFFNLLVQICRAELRFRVRLSVECQDLIRQCLQVQADLRPGLQDILEHPWLQTPKKSSEENLVSILLNFFLSSLTTRPNKLEGLPLVTLSSWVLEFEGKARANPIRGSFRCFPLG